MATSTPLVEDGAKGSDGRSLRWPAPAIAAVAAAGLVVAIAFLAGASEAVQRPLWLDEIVTQLIAHAPRGLLHAMRAGVDFQPPPHYLLVRFSDALAGGASPAAARFPSVVAALLTVLVVAAMLRTTFSLAASLAGALALAAHPLFIAQAFEARPYALWILATALTAESLREGRRARWLLMATAASVLCATHYFGVLSLAALALGAALYFLTVRRATWTAATRAVAPLAAGGVVLLLLLPLARAQLAATHGRSWVTPATPGAVIDFLRFPWGWRPALMLVVAGALVTVLRRSRWIAARLPRGDSAPLGVTDVALLSTALVPVMVVLVSITYKPVLVLRYSAPAVLAVATLVAFAVERYPALLRWAAVVLLVRAAHFSYHSAALGARDVSALAAGEASVVRQLAAHGIRTVAPFRHDAYQHSQSGADVAWIDVPDSLLERAAAARIPGMLRDILLVERDFGRAAHAEFGFPTVVSTREVRATAAVALVRDATMAAADTIWLPGRVPCRLTPRVVVYAAAGAPLPCAALQSAH